MNKIITYSISILAAMSMAVMGCKSVPTDSQVYVTSCTIGVSAGLIANSTKLDDSSRNAVIDIMNEVEMYVPETNQTFTAAWTPIALKHIAQLITDGKITKEQGELIAKAFNVAISGVDYIFNVRFPEARKYQELVEAATHGFCTGFLSVFKPANTRSSFSSASLTYDIPAYEYLKANCK